LAALAERQMRGDRVGGPGLRAACAFPGRDRLLAGPIAAAPVFRSTDRGATWSRVIDPPLPLLIALREEVERVAWQPPLPPRPRPQQQDQQRRTLPPESPRGGITRYGGAPSRGQLPAAQQRRSGLRAGPDTMLSFVDPARLLA